MHIYAAYHKDEKILKKSSSGGMFTAISDYVILNGGVVVSACYNYENDALEHSITDNVTKRDEMRGSKYMQSYIPKKIYENLEKNLKDEKTCLFTGTPCQVSAIKKYVETKGINEENLITCDILCHGVGSPGIWKSYIGQLRKKTDINYITFKDKKNGWKSPRCVAKSKNRETSIRGYSWLYFSDNIMRPSCHECKYATKDRQGDFTIGDYWKIKTKHPHMYNYNGTSVLMVNSDKAKKIFEVIKKNLVFFESSYEDCMQTCMKQPVKAGKYREEIMDDYRKMAPNRFFSKWKRKLFAEKVKNFRR